MKNAPLLILALVPVILLVVAGVFVLAGFSPTTSSTPSVIIAASEILVPLTLVFTPLLLFAYVSPRLDRPGVKAFSVLEALIYITSFVLYVWSIGAAYADAPFFWFSIPAFATLILGYALTRLKHQPTTRVSEEKGPMAGFA
jgi:hypothetical protein